jgi:hypothetical protein
MNEKAKCGKCGGTDFTDGGKCRACQKIRNEAYRIKHAGGGSAVKSKTKAKDSKPAAISAPPAAAEVLEIQQGYGLKAHIDEPYLFVAQDDGEGETDTVCLSRAEFRQLLAKYGSWAA